MSPESHVFHPPAGGGRLEIAVAAVHRAGPGARPEVLIARRPDSAVRGGLWEFPGGKLAPGETAAEAAARELAEETGVVVPPAAGKVLGRTEQDDHGLVRERSIALVLVAFEAPAGADPRPLASAECRWERLDRLDAYAWPEANVRLNRLLLAHLLHRGSR